MITVGELAYYEYERVFGSVKGDPRAGTTTRLRAEDEPAGVLYDAEKLAEALSRFTDGAGRTHRAQVQAAIAAAVIEEGSAS